MTEQKRIGRYDVLGLLGRGGMAAVYEVKAAGSNERHALKLLDTPDPDLAERFRREARTLELLGRLDHFVKIRDAGEDRGRLFIVMDLLPGGSLEDRVKNGPLPEREAARILVPVARAVHVMHELGIIHRDLKPQNILFDGAGRAVVVDLGIARDRKQASLTESGAMFGSVQYMAPEQANDTHSVDRRADVWAIGAILYRIATGSRVFEGSATEILKQVLLASPVPARRVRAGLSEAFEAVCEKALARSPDKRYPTAEALAQDLERLSVGSPPAWTGAATRPSRQATLALASIALLSLVANVALAVSLRSARAAVAARPASESPSREAFAALAGARLDGPLEDAIVAARDDLGRARALVLHASASPRGTPEERETAARLVELALRDLETAVLVDLDPTSRAKAGQVLLEASRDGLAPGERDASRVARARWRLLRARILLPRSVSTLDEARKLTALGSSGRADVVMAVRPFVTAELNVSDALEALEQEHVDPATYAKGDETPALNHLHGVLDGRGSLDGNYDKFPRKKRDAYWEALLFHPDVPSLWGHVADETCGTGEFAISARCSDEASWAIRGQRGSHGYALLCLGRLAAGARELRETWDQDQANGYLGCVVVRAYFELGDVPAAKDMIGKVTQQELTHTNLIAIHDILRALGTRVDALGPR